MNQEQIKYVDDAITKRQSIRAFLDKQVPIQTIQNILKVASRAPSVTNTQPMEVLCGYRK